MRLFRSCNAAGGENTAGGVSAFSAVQPPRAPLRASVRLALGYWKSSEKWSALALALVVVALDLGAVYVSVMLSYWDKDFFDALADRRGQLFVSLMLQLAWIYGLSLTVGVAKTWFRQLLEIRWRGWLTRNFLARWLSANRFHHLEAARATDNPDQRLAEDLREMVAQTTTLTLGLFSTVCSLVQFSLIIWTMSGALAFTVAGTRFEISGYMFWIALVYSLGAGFFVEKFAHRMVSVEYEQQRREADFRFALARVRDHSAQIAICRGGAAEEASLRALFEGIRANWRLVMRYTKRLNIFQLVHIDIGAYLPYLVIAPRYFAGLLTLGDMQQLVRVFQRLRIGFSWFIYNYERLASLRAIYRRLHEFETALDAVGVPAPGAPVITLTRVGAGTLRVRGLKLALPDGSPLVDIGSLDIAPGGRWLVRGPSGAGKSTFLKTLAGIWPHGTGAVDLPDGAMLFLPQEPYLPLGTLKAALAYPGTPSSFSDKAAAAVLEKCRLAPLAARLRDDAPWEKILSPGEKQRLGFARALLHRPAFLFLDEATSALDAECEHALMTLLRDELPRTAVISVAHRDSLAQFHDHTLNLSRSTTTP
jgi:putative ATP-binding cassette transporter